MTSADLAITLLGEFSLTVAGNGATHFTGDRPISLLAYLLLHRHMPVSRQHLAFTLWPDSTESQARANLRNLFFTLRQTMPQADDFLAADSLTLQWRADTNFTLDVANFEAALADAVAAVSAQDKISHLEIAVSLYKGDLLPGNYDDWIMPLREELRQQYLDALHQLIALLEQQQDYRAAARYSQRLLQLDPLDERAYVQLMRLHALSGDRAGLRRLYDTCVTTLRRELDVEPSPSTQAAYEQLLRLEVPAAAVAAPSLEIESPSPTTPAPVQPRPLPQPTTPFIGREAELGHLAELLADPDCRLLTIIGPGGMGKTRLALETAGGHQRIFADGVVWVPLMPVQTADQVATALAEALRHRLSGATQATDELIHVLENKQMLLVLDNFEHVMDATTFLMDILEKTTAVKLLVTSQHALALQVEWRFELGEMPLPDEAAPETLSNNSAIVLFEQSARRAVSNLTLTPEDYLAIARICHLVGGIPLGIELAASWMRLLSCTEIAEEIERSLDFLTVTVRNIPSRHRSLRAVFDYSWQLLSSAEQQALARLSLFRGGFTREAATQVAGANLPLLSALTDRSLVQRTAVGRYSLHSLVRQYANDYLQADPENQKMAAQQHSDYYLGWLADREAELRGVAQKDALVDIALELANIRIAWQQAVDTQQFALLRATSFPLFYFYELRGLVQEAESTFHRAADTLANTPNAASREGQLVINDMRTNWGYFQYRLGQITAAFVLLEQVVAHLQALGDEAVLSYSLRYLALALAAGGHYDEALQFLQQSLALAERHDRRWEIPITQAYIGMVLHDMGEIEEAQPYIEAALSGSRALGDLRLIAYCLMLAGRSNLELERLDLASEQLETSLAMGEETNDPYTINVAYSILGLIRRAQGDLTSARLLLGKAVDLFGLVDDLVGAERISVNLGLLEIDAGNLLAAKTLFLNMLQVKHREHPPRYMLMAALSLAVIRNREGDPFTALVWTLFILQQPTLDGRTQVLAEKLQAELEDELTSDQISTARACAAQLSLDEIVAKASSQ